MDDWEGRGAIITGANSGIGAAITEKLIKMGMKVVGLDINTNFLETLKNDEKNKNFHFFKTDFNNEEEILEAFQMVEETVGGANVLVNNVGIIDGSGSLLNGKKEEWKKVTRVNVLSGCLCAREFIRSAADRTIPVGHIVNICSPYAQRAPRDSTHHFYSGSQSAAYRCHLHLRQELEFRDNCIKVTNILPKLVNTPFYKNCVGDEFNEKMLKAHNSLQPEDVADAVEYVLKTSYHVQVRDIYLEAAENFD